MSDNREAKDISTLAAIAWLASGTTPDAAFNQLTSNLSNGEKKTAAMILGKTKPIGKSGKTAKFLTEWAKTDISTGNNVRQSSRSLKRK